MLRNAVHRLGREPIAIIAVALSLTGGTAYAAHSLITGAEVKDGSLTGADLQKGSLNTSELSGGAIRDLRGGNGQDGKNGTQGSAGAQGPAGPQGPKGDTGTQGPQGPHGPAGADAEYQVSSLADDASVAAPGWASRGNPVPAGLDADGAKLGPFADGTAWAGVRSHALDGVRLKDIARIAYSAKFEGNTDGGSAPYVIIATIAGDGSDHTVVFTPAQDGVAPKVDTWQRWVVTQGTVRYDDEAGAQGNPGQPWATELANHMDDTVAYIQFQGGNNGSTSSGSTSHVKNVTLEANGASGIYPDYTFGS
jgi:hypothetical protein